MEKPGVPGRVTRCGPVLGWVLAGGLVKVMWQVGRCLAGSERDWNHEHEFTKSPCQGKSPLVRERSGKKSDRRRQGHLTPARYTRFGIVAAAKEDPYESTGLVTV